MIFFEIWDLYAIGFESKTKIVQNNEFWVQSKNGIYESIDPAELNLVYNQLVARFISFFCSDIDRKPVTYNTDSVRQGVREYIALGSKDIGRLGCFWMTDEMLGLLDSLFMVRTFRITQPDIGLPLIQPLQYNNDEIIAMTTDTPFDYIFEMDNNKLFPLGIQFIFFMACITIQFCWSMIKISLVSYRYTITRRIV